METPSANVAVFVIPPAAEFIACVRLANCMNDKRDEMSKRGRIKETATPRQDGCTEYRIELVEENT